MFVFKTKAQNLEQFADCDAQIVIPPFRHFTREQWAGHRHEIVEGIRQALSDSVIVRSSALGEDAMQRSMAGAFASIVCRGIQQSSQLESAIDDVFMDMSRGRLSLGDDRVLVQNLIEDVSMSGVIFSRDLSSGAPYLVVNYDDESGQTDTVTSGVGESSGRTLWVHRSAVNDLRSQRFTEILKQFLLIEEFVGWSEIDVEFALLHDGAFVLFQVRPLIVGPGIQEHLNVPDSELLERLSDFCRRKMTKDPSLSGSTTILGQMPDWNPAEIVGRAPKRLARELYEFLITDSIWAQARFDMGYKDVSDHPLVMSLAGQPFVDVRVSLNSFLPMGLPAELSEKLVDAWIARLVALPQFHDKVEFEIATPNFVYDLAEFYGEKYPNLLTEWEIDTLRSSLRHLASTHLSDSDAGRREARQAICELENQQFQVQSGNTDGLDMRQLLLACQKLGTKPFALLARHAFAARSMLLSLERLGHLSPGFTASVQSTVRTVATDFTEEVERATDETSLAGLLEKFGHLRPGTYEIGSPRYDEMPLDLFLRSTRLSKSERPELERSRVEAELELTKALRVVGEVDWTAADLLDFFEQSVQDREYAKFIFSRTLSLFLKTVSERFSNFDLTREDLGFLPLSVVLASSTTVQAESYQELLPNIVDQGRKDYLVTKSLKLPVLICDPEAIRIIPIEVSHANFISSKSVVAPVTQLSGSRSDWHAAIDGSIVAIESADPGFDWIFSRGIAGLVTRYGGANSHMAIRCAEFGIPAAIGCGEEMFGRVIAASVLDLDCTHQSLRPLK